jgi:hypothetical protein
MADKTSLEHTVYEIPPTGVETSQTRESNVQTGALSTFREYDIVEVFEATGAEAGVFNIMTSHRLILIFLRDTPPPS